MRYSKNMITKSIAAACLLGGVMLVNSAQAQDKVVTAKVVNRTPVMETVQVSSPQKVCREEQVVTQRHKSYTPSIFGGIVGAVVGNQFGSGGGRTVATVAGAAVGASVGDNVERRNRHRGHTAYVERCHDEPEYHYEDRITGYRVTYEYDGHTYMTHTNMDPGDTIQLHIHEGEPQS